MEQQNAGTKMSYTKKPDSDELGTHSRRASYENQSAANNSIRFFDRKVKQKQFYIKRLQEIAEGEFLSSEGKNESKKRKNNKKKEKNVKFGVQSLEFYITGE